MTSPLRRAGLTAMTAALVGLTACSANDTARPQVASLPSTSTSTHPAAGGSAAGPVAAIGGAAVPGLPPHNARTDQDRTLPLGYTRAQSDRLDAVWHSCWKAVGIPPTGYRGDAGLLATWKMHDIGRRRDLDAKFAACEYLEPRFPPQLDPKTNPDYWDQLRVQAKCVRKKGYDVSVEKGDIPGLSLGNSAMASMGSPKFERDFGSCEVEAFSP